MKPASLKVARPTRMSDAVRLLAEQEDAKVIAGGQSLVPVLNFRLIAPSVLIDISRIQDFGEIRLEEDEIVIPATATHTAALNSAIIRRHCPLLPKAIRYVGHMQIRNRGTVCGSIAHADRAAEIPGAVLAAEASVIVQSVRGSRRIAWNDLFVGPYTTTIATDELLVEARFPTHSDALTAFEEITRRSGDFPIAGVAAVIRVVGQVVASVALAAVGVESTPVRLVAAEAALRGRVLSEAVGEAVRLGAAECSGFDDLHADAAYRRDAIAILIRRAVAGAQ